MVNRSINESLATATSWLFLRSLPLPVMPCCLRCLLRREPLERAFSGRALLAAGAWTLLAWLATGAIAWAFAADLAPEGTPAADLAMLCLSGFALAAAVGMASVLLPAGVGVREGVLLLLLLTAITAPAATAVVILTRFVTVVADVAWAGLGWAWARAHHLLPGT